MEKKKSAAKKVISLTISFTVGVFASIFSIILHNRRTTNSNRDGIGSIEEVQQRAIDNHKSAEQSIERIESIFDQIRTQKYNLEDDSIHESWNNCELFDSDRSN